MTEIPANSQYHEQATSPEDGKFHYGDDFARIGQLAQNAVLEADGALERTSTAGGYGDAVEIPIAGTGYADLLASSQWQTYSEDGETKQERYVDRVRTILESSLNRKILSLGASTRANTESGEQDSSLFVVLALAEDK